MIKIGTKLYKLIYWHGGLRPETKRELQVHTVSKINPKTYGLKGKLWRIAKAEIGIEYFLSKQEAYHKALTLHEEAIIENSGNRDFRLDVFKREVKYLKNKLQGVAKND